MKFKMVDQELFRHIKLNEVTMRSFLLRWIRCLHTREFELEDSFQIWDNILLDYHLDPKYGLNFVECTTLAMLVFLRDIALKKDSSFEILQLYQKYPQSLRQVPTGVGTSSLDCQRTPRDGSPKIGLEEERDPVRKAQHYRIQIPKRIAINLQTLSKGCLFSDRSLNQHLNRPLSERAEVD